MGDCLEAYLDPLSISGLEDCLQQDLSVAILFAGSIDPESLCLALKLSTTQIQRLDMLDDTKLLGSPEHPGGPVAPVRAPDELVADAEPTVSALEDRLAMPKAIEAGVEPSRGLPSSRETSSDTLRIRVDLLTHLMNLAGELVLGRNQLMRALSGEARETGLGAILQNINQVTTELQEGIMQTRMQPADAIFNRFPRIIRDMAKQLGKQINLEIQGSEVELDKSLVELLTDPLTHIIRNCADHAIEMPEERRRGGKDAAGRILLRAYHQEGHVNIAIQDDGRGIDAVRVGEKAVEKGIITAAQAAQMGERELINLIFAPGFSTVEKVSDLSGRGVGMDVVRSNTEKMGGSVEVDTTVGKGTTILLRLPLTLAIIPSMIVGVKEQRFAIPQVHVVEFVAVPAADYTNRIERVHDSEVLRLRDRLLPLMRLADVLHIPGNIPPATRQRLDSASCAPALPGSLPFPRCDYNIVVVQVGLNQFGIVVDELFDIEEIVVKPTSSFAQNSRCFSGATILGDGHVILILDLGGLVAEAGMQFADLQATQQRRLDTETEKAILSASRRRPIILCTGAADEYMAIAQDSILRLEMFPAAAIQHVGEKEFVNYRGHGLPLIRLEKYLDVGPVSQDLKEFYVIIPKTPDKNAAPVARGGIVISAIIDALEVDVELEPIEVGGPGVLGSAFLNENLTLFLALNEVIEAAGLLQDPVAQGSGIALCHARTDLGMIGAAA